MNRYGVIHPRLIRSIAKLLVSTNKNQLRLYDDLDSDNWKDYVMNGEKVTTYDDELVFKNSGKVFTLSGDVLKMTTDYRFNTTESPDPNLITDIMDEMHFDIHSRDKF